MRGCSWTLALACLGVLALSAAATPARADGQVFTYRILDGEMSYAGDAERSCTYPGGTCQDYSGGFRLGALTEQKSTDANFSVFAPGETEATETAAPAVIEAPLSIDAWTHSYSLVQTYSETPCGSPITNSTVDSDLTHDGGTDPTFYRAALVIAPGSGNQGLELSLLPPEGTEPRFGWLWPAGLRWDDSTRYSTVLETFTGSGPADCVGSNSQRVSLVNRDPFTFFPFEELSLAAGPTSYEDRGCSGHVCVVRAEGSSVLTFPVQSSSGDSIDGSLATEWWFDIEVLAGGAPPACADGVSNDFDGLSDYPSDPGCSDAEDESELGPHACDNGVDDEGDGRIDYPADTECGSPLGAYEQFECRVSGQKMRGDLYFKGKVALDNSPDAHLFSFEPSLIYCFGGGRAEIFSANTWSFIDAGADTAALEALGFKVGYDSEAESAVRSSDEATFSGDFFVTYNLLSLSKRFDFGSDVVKKRLSKKFSKRLAKKLKRFGYKSEVRSALLRAAYDIRKKGMVRYDDWAASVVSRTPRLVRPLAKNLAKRLRGQVEAKLKQYERNVGALVSTDRFARKSADEMTAIMVDAAIKTFSSSFERSFSVWSPLVSVKVGGDGHLDVRAEGFRNPFLTVDDSRQLVALP
jgi:hypothetical protein